MKRIIAIIICAILVVIILPSGQSDERRTPDKDTLKDNEDSFKFEKGMSTLDMILPTDYYIVNEGQLIDDSIELYSQNGNIWFTESSVWYEIIYSSDRIVEEKESPLGIENPIPERGQEVRYKERGVVIRQEFVNSNSITPVGQIATSHYQNYFIGDDPERWKSHVPGFHEVWFYDLWENIDLRYYILDGGVKYDFIVNPGGEVEDIAIMYSGVDSLSIIDTSAILLHTEYGDVVDGGLYVYQDVNGVTYDIDCEYYLIDDSTTGFQITNDYDSREQLVIDPFIECSTFIGGSSDDYGYSSMYDKLGNILIAGHTSSNDFPTTVGAYDQTHNGSRDVFFIKMDAKCSALLLCTYIGGANSDYCYENGIAMDPAGNIVITGNTLSNDFPTTSGVVGPNDYFSSDIYVCKFSNDGSTLMFSTYIGGNDAEYSGAIIVEDTGNIVITGQTLSSDFPTTSGAFDTTFGSFYSSAYVTKINNDGTSLLYSTYLGGSTSEWGTTLALDEFGNYIVMGYTISSDFPIASSTWDDSYNGGSDIFIALLKPQGTGSGDLLFSSFLGGGGIDVPFDFIFDEQNNIFILGDTESSDYPTTSGAYLTKRPGGRDCFVTKFSQGFNTLLASTYISGKSDERSFSLDLDRYNCPVITGWTLSENFPTTQYAFDRSHNGDSDIFLTRLNNDLSMLLSSTYLGLGELDEGYGVMMGEGRYGHLVGSTKSALFPTTDGAYDTTHNNRMDVYSIKFTDYQHNITSASLLNTDDEVDTAFTQLQPYTLQISTYNNIAPSQVLGVKVIIDPDGPAIELEWDAVTGQITKSNDPQEFIILEDTSSARNAPWDIWTVDFNITFNWNYPHEEPIDVQVTSFSDYLPDFWLNRTGLFRVENDLNLSGLLSVNKIEGGKVKPDQLVRGGSELNFSGLTIHYDGNEYVYPPESVAMVSIWEEDGSSWYSNPIVGEPFFSIIKVPELTYLDGYDYVINISGPPSENDASDISLSIRIDSGNVLFSDPFPSPGLWQTTNDLEIGVTISDEGGASVRGDNIRYSLSENAGVSWSAWQKTPRTNAFTIDVATNVTLPDGNGNLVRWSAQDTLGNGPSVSESYRIPVDTESIVFNDPFPAEDAVFHKREVDVGIEISDMHSGVNSSSISYSVSLDKGEIWSEWMSVSGYVDGPSIDITLPLSFENGTENRVRWMAFDVAGNGPSISEPQRIHIHLPSVDVILTSPANGTAIISPSVELSWSPLSTSLDGITYDVYLDTMDPPNKIIIEKTASTSHLAIGLELYTRYYWKVIAYLDGMPGRCVSGVWSLVYSKVPIVNLVSPVNGTVVNHIPPTLKWQSVGDRPGIEYDVYVGETNPPTYRKLEAYSKDDVRVYGLEDGKTYYWTVVPFNEDGMEGEYGRQVWQFTIDIPDEYEVAILPIEDLRLHQGEMISFQAVIQNIGLRDDVYNVSFEAEGVAEGLVFDVENGISLRAGDSESLSILLQAPPVILIGTYQVSIIVISSSEMEGKKTVSANVAIQISIIEDEVENDKTEGKVYSQWIWLLPPFIIITILSMSFYFIRKHKNVPSGNKGEPKEDIKDNQESDNIMENEIPT